MKLRKKTLSAEILKARTNSRKVKKGNGASLRLGEELLCNFYVSLEIEIPCLSSCYTSLSLGSVIFPTPHQSSTLSDLRKYRSGCIIIWKVFTSIRFLYTPTTKNSKKGFTLVSMSKSIVSKALSIYQRFTYTSNLSGFCARQPVISNSIMSMSLFHSNLSLYLLFSSSISHSKMIP